MSTPFKPSNKKTPITTPGNTAQGSLAKSDISRVLPRQVSSGTMRGTQIVTGVFQMNDPNNVPRMIIDAPNADIKISQAGVNVYTASDSQLIFNSNQNIYKIVLTGTNTLVNDGSTETTLTIPHNLGFTPIAQCFLNDTIISGVGTDLSLPLPTYTQVSIGGVTAGVVTFSAYLSFATDSTNLYVLLFNATGSPVSYNITYYLLQEAGSL